MAKILVVSSPLPFPPKGANALDRASGLLQYLRLGFKVKLITSVVNEDDLARSNRFSSEFGIEVVLFREPSGPAGPIFKRARKLASRLAKNPLLLDGSAGNFNSEEIKKILDSQMESWRPDIVWFERSYTWPLYKIVKRYGVPIITRSHNFEPIDYLESHGNKPQNYPSFIARFISEILTIKGSNLIFTISPQEAHMYERAGAKNATALPLRHLPNQLAKNHQAKKNSSKILSVFFTSSTYKVPRNRKTLGFVLKEIIPRVEKIAPDSFRFHIFGDKLPQEYDALLTKNVFYRGYVEDLDGALKEMDIALGNNLAIAGMQGKIFEPLARGFPIITSPKGLAGYNEFKNEQHLLFAQTADEFAHQLIRLKNFSLRHHISTQAKSLSTKLFSQEALDAIILENLFNVSGSDPDT